jgi:hypothetical protein
MKKIVLGNDEIVYLNHAENRGGYRKGSGRPKLGNVQYKRNVPLSFVELMDNYLKKLKDEKII